MKTFTRFGSALAIVAALSAAAGAQTASQSPTPPTTTAPATPAGPTTTFTPSLGNQNPLHVAVEAYGAFQGDITLLRASPMESAADLDRVLDRAASQNRMVLARGIMAYGGLTMAQSAGYAQGVRDAAAFFGRDRLIRAVATDPRYARLLNGSDEATGYVLEALGSDGQRVAMVGNRFTGLSRSMQRVRWVSQVASAQPGRLSRLRALSQNTTIRSGPAGIQLAVPATAQSPRANQAAFGGRQFWDQGNLPAGTVTVAQTASTQTWRPNPQTLAVLDRMAALGALHILGIGAADAEVANQLLNDPITEHCLHMRQLEFYNAISSARFNYENMYGLGEAVSGVGSCIGGLTEPVFEGATLR